MPLQGFWFQLTSTDRSAKGYHDCGREVTFEDTAAASSLISTMRQFASAAGVAVISTILIGRINAQVGKLDMASATPDSALLAQFNGYHHTFIISGIVALLGAVLVVMFRKDSGKNLATEQIRRDQPGEGNIIQAKPATTGAD